MRVSRSYIPTSHRPIERCSARGFTAVCQASPKTDTLTSECDKLLKSLDRLAVSIVGSAACALHLCASPVAQASTPDVSGLARIVDGDTVEIDGTRVRLFGVDAPELKQSCTDARGKQYACGQEARQSLENKVGGSPVQCKALGLDPYGRTIGICTKAGEDLNAWMVSQGQAVAYTQYSKQYVAQESQAQISQKGIWAGKFEVPSQWRAEHKSGGSGALPPPGRTLGMDKFQQAGAPLECAIKGNISSSGEKIYHVPGGKYYERTVISTTEGERWFCSSAEAEKAGWRAALG